MFNERRAVPHVIFAHKDWSTYIKPGWNMYWPIRFNMAVVNRYFAYKYKVPLYEQIQPRVVIGDSEDDIKVYFKFIQTLRVFFIA